MVIDDGDLSYFLLRIEACTTNNDPTDKASPLHYVLSLKDVNKE